MKVDEIDLRAVIENESNDRFNRNNKICCPIHKERTPSLSLDVKRNKWHCFGCGCGGDAIDFISQLKGFNYIEACKYLGVDLNEDYKVIVEEEEKVKNYINWCLDHMDNLKDWKLIKLYRFEDEDNKTLYFTAKFSTPSKKEIRYFSIVDGEVKWNRNSDAVPYKFSRLTRALKENKPVFIVEGEKDADTINHLGYVATSLKGIKNLPINIFHDANIYSIADTGEAGEQYQEHIWYELKDKIKHFRVVELPNIEKLGDNADVTDWFKDGHTKEEFKIAMKDSWDWKVSKLYKYVTFDKNMKAKPLLVWENLEILLKRKGITLKYNELSKSIEYFGSINSTLNNNATLEDIYSLCHKEHFKISKENLAAALNRIAQKYKYNPVQGYLEECLKNYDKTDLYIKALCETIVTPEGYDENIKEIFVTKWLLNVCNIAFNDGTVGSEGILVIQGAQGLGKTRWIKSIVPNKLWVKTGLEVDPSDKDKVYQATKYWITELGELDATLKKDQAKLKAFFTESMDEYRRPYERFTETYPRLTAFYATVNKEEFLKDETGNRRYWTIPAKEMIVEHYIELDQLWGEVMYKLRVEKLPHWLTDIEKELLKRNNESFEVKDETYTRIADCFVWETDKDFWCERYTSTELAELLGIKNMTTIKSTLEKFGVKQRKSGSKRFYELPPLAGSVINKLDSKRDYSYGY